MRPRWASACVSIALVAGIGVGASAVAAAAPRCFGAASRDPARRCENPRLRLTVVPTPDDAPLIPGTPCTKLKAEALIVPCVFGASPAQARGSFLLAGDSHAAQWRPALDVVARRQRWRGYQITRNGCPLTTVPRAILEPYFSQCAAWKSQLLAWLSRHPEIDIVFTSQMAPAVDAFGAPGVPFATQVGGHVDAWNQLPASVRHLFVIRDNPAARYTTMACVGRALTRRRPPGRTCALPRRTALPADPAVPAVAQLAPPRARLIDLTPFFCGARRCYPVVGGVLVFKDVNHITPVFAETLGPFVLRDVRRHIAAGSGAR